MLLSCLCWHLTGALQSTNNTYNQKRVQKYLYGQVQGVEDNQVITQKRVQSYLYGQVQGAEDKQAFTI